ncbi:binding-protein-dependent transport systems inner membrane component [Magnetococcus marinus MC-1]|uniref:Binding-protein-dependent transport systems inner membrane component n=1 Tax=Magnetococcus marinus (strain ATCC BAA-1437 / JCM 17883 / MC-1) TaxID=156889 RepID=A0L7N1_MAGMM|nr:ABC transporter permease [Magnetococcus marinus]ABK43974.1 binding-protein-dependent transport systems inner membrane component [Magnetococcus marinus MC-1]
MGFWHPTPYTRQRWLRFKQHRRGYWSLWIFSLLFALSLGAELISNDKPLLLFYEGRYYTPVFVTYAETSFGGDFETEADYKDPFILEKLTAPGNWVLFPPNPHSYQSINLQLSHPAPSPPDAVNRLGTDDRARDVLARLIYGFRVSVLFALALTLVGVVLGILAGAIQGYFVGKVDLIAQRFIEIWGGMPELYLLIIFASIFDPSILLLLLLLSLFGWMGLSDYVRAEFLRGRGMTYVKAARAMGASNRTIMFRHLLPNAMTPVITFLPFRITAAILSLTSLDFLGLGVPPTTPSLGELLRQGKGNIEAWWLSLTTFLVLVVMLMLLNFIGEALRDAMDPRKE